MTQYKPFGQLKRGQKLALMAAWVDGEDIEFKHNGKEHWEVAGKPTWQDSVCYRIAVIPDSINWDHVHPDYNYMTRDCNGSFLHKNKPLKHAYVWMVQPPKGDPVGAAVRATAFASYKQGKTAWQDSLVIRPGHVE